MPHPHPRALGTRALITGASSGIGAEFARQLAARGLNIVLLATNEQLLCARASEIASAWGVQTRVVCLDLGQPDLVQRLAPQVDDLQIGLLVSNAAISKVAPFLTLSPAFLTQQLDINSRAGLLLARHFAPQMVARGHGGIVLMSSGSAQHGTPYSAGYAATKAYNLILAEALWYEIRPQGVGVLGFMAGATHTDGWDDQHPKPDRFVPVMDAGPAVVEALRALGRRPSVAVGRTNRLGYALMDVVTRARAVKILGSSMETMFGPFGGQGKE